MSTNMNMAMNINVANVAPPSPAASPRSSPPSSFAAGRNLKVHNGTQIAHDHSHPVPAPLLDAWDQKYNRCSAPLMTRKHFMGLVETVLRELGSAVATDATLEAALAERMQRETHELTTRLEQVKRHVFLQESIADEVDDLLPFVQQESRHGWLQYTIRTLSVLPQLYAAQQATANLPRSPRPPPASTQPQLPKPRATRIQKSRKPGHIAPVRRSGRIKQLARRGAQ